MDQMAPKAKLTDEEKNWVLAYVSTNAKTELNIVKSCPYLEQLFYFDILLPIFTKDIPCTIRVVSTKSMAKILSTNPDQ